MKGFDFEKELVLPDSLRRSLGSVYGKVIQSDELEETAGSGKRVYAVGDMVVAELLGFGIVPKVAIFDYRIERKRIVTQAIKRRYTRAFVVRNRPGAISRELWNVVKRAASARSGSGIRVIGEEDLASLACINLAKNGSIVMFGLRGRGVDVVKVDAKAKRFVLRVLEQMKAYNRTPRR